MIEEFVVLLTGKFVEGLDEDLVKDNLAKKLKLSRAHIDKYYEITPRKIKTTDSRQKAEKLIQLFRSCGAICVIEGEEESHKPVEAQATNTSTHSESKDASPSGTEPRQSNSANIIFYSIAGILGLLIILVSLFGINEISWFLVSLCGLLIYYDATENRIGKTPEGSRMTNTSAGAWAIATLFLWIFVYPLYLIKRSSLIRKAKVNPVVVKNRIAKMIFLGWLSVTTLVIGTILLVVENQDGASVGEVASAEQVFTKPAAQALTLSELGNSCDMYSANGQKVEFYPTKVNKKMALTSKELCDWAGDLVDEVFLSTKKSVEDLYCKGADSAAKMYGGDFDEATRRFSLSAPSRSDTEQWRGYVVIMKGLEVCRSEAKIVEFAKSVTVTKNIFSVGTIKYKGKKCKAYMTEMTVENTGNYFELYGVGKCSKVKGPDSDQVWHPVNKPNAIKASEYLKKHYQYSGEMPDTFTYRGSVYQF